MSVHAQFRARAARIVGVRGRKRAVATNANFISTRSWGLEPSRPGECPRRPQQGAGLHLSGRRQKADNGDDATAAPRHRQDRAPATPVAAHPQGAKAVDSPARPPHHISVARRGLSLRSAGAKKGADPAAPPRREATAKPRRRGVPMTTLRRRRNQGGCL